MIKNRSKQKGSEFERSVCKSLSKWVSHGKDETHFWRSAMSGGRATVQLNKGVVNKDQAGDISNISTDNKLAHKLVDHFVVECKHYKDLNFNSLLFGTPKDASILRFWNKLYYEDSVEYGKSPMLIAKQNYCPTIMAIVGKGKFQFLLTERKCFPLGVYPTWNVVLFNYEEVLKRAEPEILEVL